MHVRLPLAITALAVAFSAGAASSHLAEREAHAQPAAFSSSVFVPADGLAFRAFDGRVVAKLSYDAHGGMFELYDGHQQPAASFRTSSGLAAPPSMPERYAAPARPSYAPPGAVASAPEPVDLGI